MFDLKEFRKSNNLTQKEAASFFGVTQAFISQIERNERPTPDNFLQKIKADPTLIFNLSDLEKPSTDCPHCAILKREISLLEKTVSELRTENKELIEKNAVLNYRLNTLII